jgi:EF-P beta-lysylation protein EpmB
LSANSTWRQILRSNFTNWTLLADFLELDSLQRTAILPNPRFSLNLPMRIAQKIRKKTLDDPLLKQFLPLLEENVHTPHFSLDPVGDHLCQKTEKLIQKYQGRVLLTCTSACAMHCRYCFRQNFDYRCSDKAFNHEIEFIRNDHSVREVILSGGDPLSLSDDVLSALLTQLNDIPHLKLLRFHTRFPIGIPERINPSFLDLLAKSQQQIWFVLHVNHPRELDPDIFRAVKQIQETGAVILSQSVLLKDVNDTVEILQELCELLIDHGIVPYYLHQLDKVQGAAHFEVEESKGRGLIEALRQRLPGYAIPQYVCEIPGEPNKTPIT